MKKGNVFFIFLVCFWVTFALLSCDNGTTDDDDATGGDGNLVLIINNNSGSPVTSFKIKDGHFTENPPTAPFLYDSLVDGPTGIGYPESVNVNLSGLTISSNYYYFTVWYYFMDFTQNCRIRYKVASWATSITENL